ncbi:ectonucleotide pyrophosphatase/phosphodiesterase family member 5 [Anaeramoeba ignava]|uniref:Ectonucleotide pyrophosphatase/phosphodiesterase family member 5 n=1 Tax=Anaeramoeba ignava TaxID=1746090 RepID=A0A9Q0LDM8_ANAIG|nr:ectonucleotide pyrophosphatase/phosphodiesterase family member 5 [Anaeramoeba ignava]
MTGIFEFKKIVSTESPMFSQNNVDSIHNDANPESTIGKTRLHSENKVVVVIFDGVRWDYMQTNKELMALLQNNSFVQDSKMFRMETSLPSMSVPNWLTIITGSQPELTGVLGNLMIPETHFDSMFNEAKNYNLSRVITASPWFGNIVKSTLPYLGGDATIATNVGAEDIDRATADPADYLRGSVAIQAIQQNYNLVLLHMSDVDIQGHAYGVDPKFNKDDSYNKALTNKTKILQSIIDELDNDTVLFWLSDHGQVDRGGHGGTDPTEMNVPLVIYKKNSNFHSMNVPSGRPRFREKVSSDYDGPEIDMSNFPQFEWPVVSNIDVAPTICALLGIPVPRTSPGCVLLLKSFWKLVLQLRQKMILILTAFLNKKQSLLPAEQVNCVHDFADYYDNNKKSTVRLYTFRNVILDLLIESLFVIGLIYIMSRYTFSDFKSIFKKPRLIFLNYRRSNVIAFLFSLIAVMVYFLISILLFFGLERGYGYKRWESTLVHAPVVIPIYMSYIIIPSTIMEYLVIRLYHGPYLIFKKFETNGSKMDKFKTLLINIRIALFSATRVRDVKMIYLIKIYLLFWTVISIFFLFLMMSGFTFILPLIFRIHFISKSTWGYHFRILTVLFISYPLIIGQLIQMATWPKFSPNTAFFDTLFQVGIQKDAIKGKKKQEQIDSKIDFTILDRNHTNQFAKNENFADIFFSNPNTIYSSVSNKLVHTITDHLVNEKNEINDEALLNEDKFQDLHFDSQDSSQREREFEDIKENDTDDK